MKFFQKLFKLYIESNLHVSLSVVSFCLITLMEFNKEINVNLLLFIFFGSLTGYNFIKYVLPASENFKKWNFRVGFLGLSSIGLLFSVFQVSLEIVILSIILGFFTFFYAVPVVKQKNLRMVAGVKIFVVALVWSGVTVLMPLLNDITGLTLDVWLTFFQRIMIVVVLMIPFELRDMNTDAIQLKTLPRQIGIQKAKILGWFLLVFILLLELLKTVGKPPYYISLILFIVLLAWILKISKSKQRRYFSSFFVEALPIVWLILLIGIKNI